MNRRQLLALPLAAIGFSSAPLAKRFWDIRFGDINVKLPPGIKATGRVAKYDTDAIEAIRRAEWGLVATLTDLPG